MIINSKLSSWWLLFPSWVLDGYYFQAEFLVVYLNF